MINAADGVSLLWRCSSFDANNTFQARDHGPIKEPTLYTVNASNGVVLNKWAENL